MLVSKHLGVPWVDHGVPDKADILDNIGVRWTSHPHGHLLLYLDDPANFKHILVVGDMPHQRIIGWAWGREGKLPQFKKRDREDWEGYWVPQSVLRGIGSLMEEAEKDGPECTVGDILKAFEGELV